MRRSARWLVVDTVDSLLGAGSSSRAEVAEVVVAAVVSRGAEDPSVVTSDVRESRAVGTSEFGVEFCSVVPGSASVVATCEVSFSVVPAAEDDAVADADAPIST